MPYSVRYEPEAFEDLGNLSKSIRTRTIKKINWLAKNFDDITPLPLRGELAGFYKLRVGNYRSIYELSNIGEQIIIVRIGHRADIYDELTGND